MLKTIHIFIGFFLLTTTGIMAQEITLFSSLYHLGTTNNEIINEYSSDNLNHLSYTVGIGAYTDFKKWTLFNEVIINHNTRENVTNYGVDIDTKYINEIPSITTLMARIGAGKKIQSTKNILVRFNSYIGYQKINRRVSEFELRQSTITNLLLYQELHEVPKENHYQIGLKTGLEYSCTKRLNLGIGFDFYFQMIKRKGSILYKHYFYGESLNIVSSKETTTFINNTNFSSSFFNISMFASYKIKKNKK